MAGIKDLDHMTQQELALLWECSTRTIQRRLELDHLRHGESTRCYYVWSECRAFELGQLSQRAGTGEDPTAKERKDLAEAELAEIKLGQLRGTLLQVEDVRATWSEVLGRVRAKLLAIPPKAAVRLGDGLTAAQRQEVIQQEVDEALAELSQGGGL